MVLAERGFNLARNAQKGAAHSRLHSLSYDIFVRAQFARGPLDGKDDRRHRSSIA